METLRVDDCIRAVSFEDMDDHKQLETSQTYRTDLDSQTVPTAEA